MIEENGHRTPYEDMVELQEFVNEGKKWRKRERNG